MLDTGGWVAVLLVWLSVGAVVATVLHRRGEGTPTVLAAVPAWPLLVPVLVGTPARTLSPRVAAALDRLGSTLATAGERVHLGGLRDGLLRAELRLARLDLLLAELPDAHADDLERVRSAREATAAEIEAVLAEMVRLRVAVGLAALSMEGAEVRPRLSELVARVRALEEVNTTLDRERYTVAEVDAP